MSVSIPWSGSAPPVLRLQFGLEFSVGNPSCTSGTSPACSVPVAFAPRHPGLRVDALRALDTNGHVLSLVYLSGVGLAPQAVLWPGVIDPFAGTTAWGNTGDGGPAGSATLGNPQGLATDSAGNLYIADSLNEVIRRVDAASHVITTVAGNTAASSLGDGGPATAAKLNSPTGIAVDGAGNLFIADFGNNRVRRVDALSGTITTVAGNGMPTGVNNLGDGGQAAAATLYGPTDVAIDAAGRLFIADSYNNRVRRVDWGGVITTVAGGGTPGAGADGIGNGGPAFNAQLRNPSGLAFDASGNLYIADRNFNLVRVVRSGIISVVAGNGSANDSGDGGAAINASLSSPSAIRVDAAGNVYIADSGNSVVRVVDGTGIIRTLAGEAGQYGLSGNGGSPLAAQINNPGGLALDDNGTLYISDQGNRAVRAVITPAQALAFASAAVGSVSVPQIVTLENIGNVSLSLDALALTGDFLQQSSGAPDCFPAAQILSGSSCSVAIAYAPQASGVSVGSLSLTSGTSPPMVVNLNGSATGNGSTEPHTAPSALTFPSTAVRSTSPAQSVTLTNPGSVALPIVGIWLAGSNSGEFALGATTCGGSVPAIGSCTVAVAFTPTAVGQRTATLVVSEIAPGGAHSFTQSIFLSGMGSTSNPMLSTQTIWFGQNAPLHVTTASQSVILTNPGPATLQVNGATLSDASNFTITGTTCGATVAAGQSCAFSVAMTPTVGGPLSAILTIYDSAAPAAMHTVALSGAGNVPMVFIPVTPCRLADTRNPNGPLGGPEFTGGVTRTFPIQSGPCAIPANALAYALNITVVPDAVRGYLSIWPAGLPLPNVSTLNLNKPVKSNLAIVLAGASGAVSIYTSHPTHVVLDLNGYFVPDTGSGGLTFHQMTPCRLVDTRWPVGALGGPSLGPGQPRSLPLQSSACGVPSDAMAYSLNFSGVPHGVLHNIATWNPSTQHPDLPILHAPTGQITANGAIVPALPGGGIELIASDSSDIVIDINGYFSANRTGGLFLYATPPCRVFDSRVVGAQQPIVGPNRIPAANNGCGAPPTAQGVILNATVVPTPVLGALALWPDPDPQPYVSTLNACDGLITSNMAILPIRNGYFDVATTNLSHVILDLSAYFAPL